MIAAATTALLLAYTPSLHPPAIRTARCAPPTLQLDALGDAVKKASSVAGDVAKAAGVDKALENVGSAVGDVAKSASSAVGGKVMEQMGLGNAGLSDEEAKGMEDRLKSGTMTFDDFLVQVKVMQKGASMQAMLGKMGGGQFSKDQIEEGQRKMERCAHAPHTRELSPHTTRTPQLTPQLTPHLCLFLSRRYGKFVEAMDAEERSECQLLIDETTTARAGGSKAQTPRLVRIAESSGSTVEEVGRFVMEFNMMRGAAVKFANGESPDSIRESMAAEQQAATGVKLNRQQRRMKAKKGKKKAAGGAGGFGARR